MLGETRGLNPETVGEDMVIILKYQGHLSMYINISRVTKGEILRRIRLTGDNKHFKSPLEAHGIAVTLVAHKDGQG